MSYTWSQARGELGRLVGDRSESGSTFSFQLREDAYNRALEAVSAKVAVASDTTITGDATTVAFDLPANIIEAPGAYFLYSEDDSKFLTPAGPMEQKALDQLPAAIKDGDRYYWEWPSGTLTLSEAPSAAEEITLYYFAHYNPVDNDLVSTEIDVPVWVREALLYYAAAYMMHAKASTAANLGQFKTDDDAGNPEHNPWEKRATVYMQRYELVMSKHASQQRRPPPRGTF